MIERMKNLFIFTLSSYEKVFVFLHLFNKKHTTYFYRKPIEMAIGLNEQLYSTAQPIIFIYRRYGSRKTWVRISAQSKASFYILIMDEKVLVLCEKWLSKTSSNLYVLRPPESEKRVFTKVSVCLSVGRARHNSR